MIPVEGHKGLYRDKNSGAIINCNHEELLDYLQAKEIQQSQKNQIEDLKNEISQSNDEFKESKINLEYNQLQEEIVNETSIKLNLAQQENKIQQFNFQILSLEKQNQDFKKILEDIKHSQDNLIFNDRIRNNIANFQARITKNENLTSKLNEKLGVLYQKYQDIIASQKLYISQLDELKLKRSEFKLMQILEQSLGKDGLPLTILENYLIPITQSINNIISPFIDRKVNLKIDQDDLILDSFPCNAEKSVYIHGGMESFILDIAFKITLSNFAKLPKCDILFLDEGISAFDTERLSNIDTLFNFIKRYFTKTILITHIDSVKENINEKIGIIKENNLSKIVCEYFI